MFLDEAPAVAPPKPTTTPTKAPPAPSKPRPGTRPWQPTRRPDVAPKPKARGDDEEEGRLKPRPKATDVGHYSSVPNANPTSFSAMSMGEADQAPVSVPPPPTGGGEGGPEPETLSNLCDMIRPGDRVTILSPHGSRLSGRATMRNRQNGCWVLNLGGPHGTPGIADEENIIAVSRGGKRIYGRI
jgi:hypothetical protein